MKGIIVWYSDNDGYGFIQTNGSIYRFRKRSWQDRKSPEVGAKVTFDAVKSGKGLRAYKVQMEGDTYGK